GTWRASIIECVDSGPAREDLLTAKDRDMSPLPIRRFSIACLLVCLVSRQLVTQAPIDAAKPPLPEIVDEPQTIDPTALIPASLAAKVTQTVASSSLRELVGWLQEQQQLVVLVDTTALTAAGISLAEPISDQLTDDPIYLLLD